MSGKKTASPALNRRGFLKMGALSSLALGSGVGLSSAGSAAQRSVNALGRARNVIVLVSDGMSSGALAMADQYCKWRDGAHSQWIQEYARQRGSRGLMEMASANSIVTDSAAASSSWGCGQRVLNGRVNMDADGKPIEPVLSIARRSGKSTGLVTTATVTHATPAGFAANMMSRNDEAAIALQYLERDYQVVLGGGNRFFSAENRDDRKDLYAAFAEQGHAVVRTSGELDRVSSDQDKILGIFSDAHLPYEVNRLHDADLKARVPSLAEMTARALTSLNRNANGFVLQVEAARVDHAAHRNDTAGLLFDQLAFDDAIKVALEFYESNPDTLVIITTDHGNANPGLSSSGGGDGGAGTFGILSKCQGTYDRLGLEAGMDRRQIKQAFDRVMQLEISNRDADLLKARLEEYLEVPYGRMAGLYAVIGQVMANHTDIGWVGNAHTSDLVELYATGPGSEQVKPFNRNTDLFTIMLDSLGLARA